MVYNLSRAQDKDESSQNSRLQSDMSTSKTDLPKYAEPKSSEEDIFDSGIHSGSNLSSGIISESDLKYSSDNLSDYEENSGSQMKHSLEGASKEETSGRCKLSLLTKLDSGIGIDCSSDLYPYQSAESSPAVPCEKDGSCFPQFYPPDERLWDSLLEPIDEDGNTRLHLAVGDENDEYVQNILRIIPSSHFLDIRNYYRQTCLHLSVLLNKPNITRWLLLAGAKTGIEDRNGNTPLHLACRFNFMDCVEALLNPVTKYEQKSAICKYKPVIDLPREYINEYNYDGLSCIHMAAVHPDLKVLRELLSNGGDVNIQECKGGYTILHDAVISGNSDLLSYIVQVNGIELDKKNYARLTPYQLSACHPRISDILRFSGASQLVMVEDESDEDYSSDDSDSEDDLYDDSCEVDQLACRMHSLSTNNMTVPAL